MLYLLRNNGIYVAVLTLIILAIYKRKEFLYLGVLLLFVLTTYIGYDKVLLPALKIPAGSVREQLSVPFQQTARYVKEHEKEISEEEKEKIDKVLGYDTFLLHPATYLEATLNNTYGYFYPDTSNWYIYSGKNYNKLITEDNLVNYHYNKLSFLRTVLSGYGIMFPYLPVVGLLSNIGFSAMALLTIIVYLLCSNEKKYIIAMLPSFLSLLICFISPANTYFRYSMPFVFLIPFYTSYVYLMLRNH